MAAEQTNPVEVDEAVPPEKLGPGSPSTCRVPAARSRSRRSRAVRRTSPSASATASTTGCCVVRRCATCSPPRTTWGANTACSRRSVDRRADAAQVAVCDDDSVIGAPFYMMARLDGVVYDDVDATASLTEAQGLAASFELMDVLARLHAVDYEAVGLGDFGRPPGYLERQVKRWQTQWEKSKTVEIPAVDEVAQRLERHLPTDSRNAIVHGDYSFNNTMFRRDDPTRMQSGARLGDVDARRSAHRRRHGGGVLDRRGRDHVAQPEAAGAPRQRRLPRRRHPARSLRDDERHRPRRTSTSTAPSPPTSWP